MNPCKTCGEIPRFRMVPESVFKHGYEQCGYECDCFVAVGIDEQDARENWDSLQEGMLESWQ